MGAMFHLYSIKILHDVSSEMFMFRAGNFNQEYWDVSCDKHGHMFSKPHPLIRYFGWCVTNIVQTSEFFLFTLTSTNNPIWGTCSSQATLALSRIQTMFHFWSSNRDYFLWRLVC